jgi:putative peptidoglycan lipid II flippase
LLNAGLLFVGLRRKRVYLTRPGWRVLLLRVAAPSIVMVVALVTGLAVAGDWFVMTSLGRIGSLAALVLGGAAVYFVACYAVGLRTGQFRIRSTV